MPVIVIGADTVPGLAIIDAVSAPHREVRGFVSDLETAKRLRLLGVKTAVGDVSDQSHVAAASLGCFTAVLVAEAARDERERAFADSAETVLAGWAQAVIEAGVHRAIWVIDGQPPELQVPEVASVGSSIERMAHRVAELDARSSLS